MKPKFIKIRWKEGAGLFVFLILSGLYFFGIPDFSWVLEYKYAYYYEELIGFLSRVVLPAPFLIGIFLLSLHKTEKRIKKGRFSFWRLLVFSLATALTTGLVWTLQFITGSGYSYESFDVVKRLFFDVGMFPVIPMTLAFIFSFVPSLLLYKFYLKQKKFYIAAASFFILLFLGLFGYQQTGDLTCGFNYDGYCVGNKAIKVKDISLCEKVKTSKEFGLYDNYGKNSCYEAISRKWHDVNLCDRIKTISNQKSSNPHYSQYQLHQCVSNIARNTKNKELCEKIPVSEFKAFELVRERCLNDSDNKPETSLNNWKIYKNEKYGFEFKYPQKYFISLPSYQIINEATGGFDLDPQEELLNKDLTPDNTKSITVWINKIDSLPIESTREKNDPLQDTTQKDLISQRAEIENSKAFDSGYVSENKNSISKIIKIGDRKLKRSIWYSHQSSGFINTLEFFSKEGDLITVESGLDLSVKTTEEAKKDSQTNVFDTIISSFKFTK